MSLTQTQLQKLPTETSAQYTARVTALQQADDAATGGTPAATAPTNQTPAVNQALGGNYFNNSTGDPVKPFVPTPAPPVSTIGNPVTPPVPGTGTPTVTLPTPTAPAAQTTYAQSATADAAAARAALEKSYQDQIDTINTKMKESQDKIDGYNMLEDSGLENIKALSAPFQADYEAAQEDALHVKENFEANQNLVNELDSLLQQGNDLIAHQQGQPIASAVLNKMVTKTMSDVAARASVIQAVMAARNSQISVAETMIDRGVAAINADRKDQIDYYNTVLNLTESRKGDEEKNLLNLSDDDKAYAQKQVSLLESDVQRTQDNADAIKKAMTDPDTALAYGQAGVTLNDDPATINQKLATYAYAQELSKTSNDMASKGYNAVLPGQKAPAGHTVVTIVDSKGVSHQYYDTSTPKATTATDKQQEQADIASMSQSLQTRLGTDGYISPVDWQHAKQSWVSGGYSAADFDAIFSVYKNPTDKYV